MHTFGIGIPTINRIDLLSCLLDDLERHIPGAKVVIVDNGSQGVSRLVKKMADASSFSRTIVFEPKETIVFEPKDERREKPFNLGVAGSWNCIAEVVFNELGLDWVLMLNDDIELGVDGVAIQAMCNAEMDRNGGPRLLVSDKGWCSFLWPRAIWEQIGPFDTQFYPCYFEDNDYAERLSRAGKPHIITTDLDPKVFRESMSSRKDPALNKDFAENERRFAAKWGAEALMKKFLL